MLHRRERMQTGCQFVPLCVFGATFDLLLLLNAQLLILLLVHMTAFAANCFIAHLRASVVFLTDLAVLLFAIVSM